MRIKDLLPFRRLVGSPPGPHTSTMERGAPPSAPVDLAVEPPAQPERPTRAAGHFDALQGEDRTFVAQHAALFSEAFARDDGTLHDFDGLNEALAGVGRARGRPVELALRECLGLETGPQVGLRGEDGTRLSGQEWSALLSEAARALEAGTFRAGATRFRNNTAEVDPQATVVQLAQKQRLQFSVSGAEKAERYLVIAALMDPLMDAMASIVHEELPSGRSLADFAFFRVEGSRQAVPVAPGASPPKRGAPLPDLKPDERAAAYLEDVYRRAFKALAESPEGARRSVSALAWRLRGVPRQTVQLPKTQLWRAFHAIRALKVLRDDPERAVGGGVGTALELVATTSRELWVQGEVKSYAEMNQVLSSSYPFFAAHAGLELEDFLARRSGKHGFLARVGDRFGVVPGYVVVKQGRGERKSLSTVEPVKWNSTRGFLLQCPALRSGAGPHQASNVDRLLHLYVDLIAAQPEAPGHPVRRFEPVRWEPSPSPVGFAPGPLEALLARPEGATGAMVDRHTREGAITLEFQPSPGAERVELEGFAHPDALDADGFVRVVVFETGRAYRVKVPVDQKLSSFSIGHALPDTIQPAPLSLEEWNALLEVLPGAPRLEPALVQGSEGVTLAEGWRAQLLRRYVQAVVEQTRALPETERTARRREWLTALGDTLRLRGIDRSRVHAVRAEGSAEENWLRLSTQALDVLVAPNGRLFGFDLERTEEDLFGDDGRRKGHWRPIRPHLLEPLEPELEARLP